MSELGLPMDKPLHIVGVSHYAYRMEPAYKNNEVFLVNVDTNGRLKCGPQRHIKNDGGRGEWSQWQVVPSGEDDGFSLLNVGHRDRTQNVYLGTLNGVLVAVDEPELLTLEPVCESAADEEAPLHPPYELNDASLKTFIETGVLHLPALVDEQLVNNALASINDVLGMCWDEENDAENFKAATRKSPALLDLLYKSPVFAVLEEMLGKGMVKHLEGGQIALRFPNNRNPREEQWHIDGSNTTHMTPFQILVGIALSSQPNNDCGNLVVFPGKHAEVHDAVFRMRQSRMDNNKKDTPWMGCRPKYGPNDSVQLKLEPGDVVFAHQKIPHRVAHNKSPHIRYMVYFRISNKRHVPEEPLGGLWVHFDGLQDVVESCGVSDKP